MSNEQEMREAFEAWLKDTGRGWSEIAFSAWRAATLAAEARIRELEADKTSTQQKLAEAEKRNEGRDLYAWRYARLTERNNIDEVGVPYVVALTERGTLEHLYFGACGQACDIEWPMPDRAIAAALAEHKENQG